ncbi:MAG: hypothetical protein FJ290_19875 [Planctomycetes bacterium]|nr:hypothetical protein [Planctomycetota bacterium]
MPSKDILIEVPKYSQHNSRCCWYASYKMLYGWKGKSVGSVRTKLEKVGIYPNDALYEDQWEKAAAALGLSGMKVSHLKDVENVAWCLSKCGPIWTAGNFMEKTSAPHAVVISGVYTDGKLRISDPYEFYHRDSYNYMTHAQWCKKVRVAPFACQLWW